MEKVKKKKIKRIIALACAGVLVITLAVLPLLTQQNGASDGPEASILSGNVETGSVNSEVIGGGTLAEDDAIIISVPVSVKLTEYLVSNGASVKEGDAIASVDKVTVMTAISEVQSTLDKLAEKIETESGKETDGDIVALASGTVKMLYAKKGDSAQDVMLEHGALAVLSLDGLMAVDFTTESKATVGTSITATLSNGNTVSGKVVSNLAGKMTVTIEDNGYSVGESVSLKDKDSTLLGSGELYIYSPWNATAYVGTIDSVKVTEGTKVESGDSLMHLTNAGYTATYRQLINQRQTYEDLMLELFKMYQTKTITAPSDGIVSGLDKSSSQLLSAGGQAGTITFMSNSPDNNDQANYKNYIGKVTSIGQNGWDVSIIPQAINIDDYSKLTDLNIDEAQMTDQVSYNPNQTGEISTPIYEIKEGKWVSVDVTTVAPGDIMLFAGDSEGNNVWIIRIRQAAQPTAAPSVQPTPTPSTEPTPKPNSQPTNPQVTPGTQPSTPGSSQNNSNIPGNSGTFNNSNGSVGQNTMNSFGGGTWDGSSSFVPSDGTGDDTEDELYSQDIAQVAAVTPQDNVTLDITINELDVSSISTGMNADVMIDALGGEKFTATITDIGNTGTNNGGYSYFTVELTMKKADNMIVGMTATATMVTATAENILTVPAEAITEDKTQTVIYTGYDEKNKTLINSVTVTVGASDGKTVEILDGLEAGATFYYAYYDTYEISNAPNFSGSTGMSGFSFGR